MGEGRPEAADPLVSAALEIRAEALGRYSSECAACLCVLADVLTELSRYWGRLLAYELFTLHPCRTFCCAGNTASLACASAANPACLRAFTCASPFRVYCS